MKTPLTFTLAKLPTPIGVALIAVDDQQRLRVFDWESHAHRMHRGLGRIYGADGVRLVEGDAPATITDKLNAFFAGDVKAVDTIAVETGGTAFQRQCWTALRTIPAGETWTYSRLADHIGRPTAVRAVGLANGSNPISVVVPCHRVIGADGSLTGYGGGLERKAWLLQHEGAR